MAREWFLHDGGSGFQALGIVVKGPEFKGHVSVIEKSSYDELVKELANAMDKIDKLEAELKEVKEENIILAVGSGHYLSERDIHIKEGEQFVIDATFKIKEQAEQITQLKTEIERVKDTPGGKRIYAAFNEIQKRDELIQKCETALDRYSHLALPERDPRLTDRYSSMPMREFAKEAVDEIKKWKKENGRS